MKKNVTVLPQKLELEKKLRVAAYARVSDCKDSMLQSLSNQVSYYSNLIQNNNKWLYAGVYIDEGVTGTKDERVEFQRMINDAKAGKIDKIITKSISRFARNTVTLLSTIRELKHIGVDVYFEEQNIHTISSDGELMITILASYAQEESRQVSENMKWRIRKNFEEGKTWNSVIYGYSYDDGIFKIIPYEAQVVRLIYDYYLSGMGVGAVTKKINEEGYLTRKNKKWNKSSVRYILTNYNYTGNLILQKTYTENHLTKKKKINNGHLPKYHVKESHEAIVSVTEYRKVQEELNKRDSLSGKRRSPQKYPFTGMIVCDKCGTNYRRKTTPYKHVWQCNNYIENGKVACDAKQVPEEILFEVSTDILELEEFNEDIFKKNIRSIKACDNNELVFTFNDETEVIKKWQNKPISESWTKEKRELARRREQKRRGEINGKNYSNSTNN